MAFASSAVGWALFDAITKGMGALDSLKSSTFDSKTVSSLSFFNLARYLSVIAFPSCAAFGPHLKEIDEESFDQPGTPPRDSLKKKGISPRAAQTSVAFFVAYAEACDHPPFREVPWSEVTVIYPFWDWVTSKVPHPDKTRTKKTEGSETLKESISDLFTGWLLPRGAPNPLCWRASSCTLIRLFGRC